MRRLMPFMALALAALNAQQSLPADALPLSPEPVAGFVTTRQKIQLDGHALTYSATVGEDVLKDQTGNPAATIFSTTYLRSGIKDRSKRPVMFLFNGGPGASSDPLHMAFGPRTVSRSLDVGAAASGAPAIMITNPYSLLDVTDLVFVDPVGTGFSRVLASADGGRYWSIDGDANAMLTFVHDWLARNGRGISPLFFCGESYGGFRLATMLGNLGNLKPDGALFISPALAMTASADTPGNDMSYILTLPSMAADAWYHNRVPRNGQTLEQTFTGAETFAETEYAAALLQGSTLTEADRQHTAEAVSKLIGLPVQFILDKNLRVSVQDFVTGLMADRGLRIGRTDGRYTGNAVELARKSPPFDDPAIAPGGSVAGLLTQYFEHDLGFRSKRPYITLAMNVNANWNWVPGPGDPRAYVNATPGLEKAMGDNSKLRVFTAGAYFDLATPLAATVYALDHAQLPKDRVTEAFYKSGHSMYQHAESHAKLSSDIRAFVAGTR